MAVAHYSTVQYSTVQYSTVQYTRREGTVRETKGSHTTVQYSTRDERVLYEIRKETYVSAEVLADNHECIKGCASAAHADRAGVGYGQHHGVGGDDPQLLAQLQLQLVGLGLHGGGCVCVVVCDWMAQSNGESVDRLATC